MVLSVLRWFASWLNWYERRKVLRDFRATQSDIQELHRVKVKRNLQEALTALELNDPKSAAAIWDSTLLQNPIEARTSPLAVQLLTKMRRFDEAETLVLESSRRHPGDSTFVKAYAEIAQLRGDHTAASQRFAQLRKRFPGVQAGYVGAARSLTALGHLEEAEALTIYAIRKFPEEVTSFVEHARIADRRQDWTEALTRWQTVRNVFSSYAVGHLCCANVMIKLEKFGDADHILSAAVVRFPTDPDVAADFARCAERQGRLADAVARWKRAAERFPLSLNLCLNAAEALSRLGDQATAKALLSDAIDRFSDKKESIDRLRLRIEKCNQS